MNITLIIVIVIAIIYLYYSEYNTMRFGQYHVHRSAADPNNSAAILAEIDRRVKILSAHLNTKYGCAKCIRIVNGHISVRDQFDMNERTNQLMTNYSSSNLYEISPNNVMGNTSFTEDKGKKIVMCLRNKAGVLHDINTIMFVALHEIAHVMNDRWGHETYFWDLFRIVLQNAVECDIYTPVDYAITPINYCGLEITQNPLFLDTPTK